MHFWFLAAVAFVDSVLLNQMCLAEKINSSHDSLNAEKKSRFLSFNSEEGEIKIELDFSIPFLIIPVKGRQHDDGTAYPVVDVNTKGLITVGAIFLFLLTVVPKLLRMFVPQAQVSTMDNWAPLMSRIDDAIKSPDIVRSTCFQKMTCLASSNPITSSLFKYLSNQWIGSSGPEEDLYKPMFDSASMEDCAQYRCSITQLTQFMAFLSKKKKEN